MKRMRSFGTRWSLAAGVLLTLTFADARATEPDAGAAQPVEAPAAARPARTDGATLRVEAKAFRSDAGRARFALFRSKDGYPGKFAKAMKVLTAEVRAGRATVAFEGLEPGVYALAVHHDENANDKVDTNWIGMPKEGLGVSNDARSTFGPPGFDEAKFELPAGGRTIALTIIYL